LQAVDDVPELGHKHSKPPFLEIRWDLQQHNSSIIYFKNVCFSVQVTHALASDRIQPCSSPNGVVPMRPWKPIQGQGDTACSATRQTEFLLDILLLQEHLSTELRHVPDSYLLVKGAVMLYFR